MAVAPDAVRLLYFGCDSKRKGILVKDHLALIRKNIRGIYDVERLRTPVTGILIVGLQLH